MVLAAAGSASASISLSPGSQTLDVGKTATVTANVVPPVGVPRSDHTVFFQVLSGPNAGLRGQGGSDANGNASYSYSSSKTGTDQVQANWQNGNFNETATSSVTWVPSTKTDVGVTLAGPTLGRVGNNGTWTATLTNSGPDAATGVTLTFSVSGGVALVSATGTGCSTSNCAIGGLGAGATTTVTLVYAFKTAGSASIAASVSGDFDTNPANNTASAALTVLEQGATPPPPPPPTQPGTFNAIPTGTVMVNGGPRPADQPLVLNSGDTVDVTNGVMTFTSSDGSNGSFSSLRSSLTRRLQSRAADNVPAAFTVTQAVGGLTTLTLVGGDFSQCGTSRSLSAASKKPVRQLWGSAKGNFRTNGRFAAATVRGTLWLVQDSCAGTLEQTITGSVAFVDTIRNRTVDVGAGATFLVGPPLKLPAQTAAQVKNSGVLAGGKRYKTRKSFEVYLRSAGQTWAEFARKYPKLAAALLKRR